MFDTMRWRRRLAAMDNKIDDLRVEMEEKIDDLQTEMEHREDTQYEQNQRMSEALENISTRIGEPWQAFRTACLQSLLR